MTKTEKWEDDWFVSLDPAHKLFWFYLCDRCDHAGIWQVSKVMSERFIGQAVDLDAALVAFGDRIDASKAGYWRLTKFIEFQYGLPLSETSQVHKSVIRALERVGYDLNPFRRVCQPLPNPCPRVKDKDISSISISDGGFETFWEAYPKKKGKGQALKAWPRAAQFLPAILEALKWQVQSPDWQKDNGQFIPHPATYLNGLRWQDENKQGTSFDPKFYWPDGRKKTAL